MRGEKLDHLVVIKGKTRGAETLGVGREIQLAADDARFKLHRAIPAIAKALQNGPQARQKKDVHGGVRWQLLIQEASAMARRGTGTRRAARELLRQVPDDRVAVETAREHFVARLAEGDDVYAERALAYLDGALSVTGRRPLRSVVRR